MYRQWTPKEIVHYNCLLALGLKKQLPVPNVIHRGCKGPLKCGHSFRSVSNRVTVGGLFLVIWFTFPLALEMRNRRPRREVTQRYLAGGWQGHLRSCLLCPSQLIVLPTPSGPTLCSPGFSSIGLSPDRELWERRSGLGRCQHPAKTGVLLASSWSS